MDDVIRERGGDEAVEAERKRGRCRSATRKVSRTDPQAIMATSALNRRLEPSYKQHTAVDDEKGVVLDCGGHDRCGERRRDDRGSGG